MKTINCNSCRAKIRKECEEDFLKHEYSIYKDLAFTFCCFSTAAVLMAHAQKGRSKKYIQALFNHLCMIYDTPDVFGKEITLTDVVHRLEQEYEIDFHKIHLRIETEQQFVRGKKK